jgi:two-component system, chemotaxis family, chemotaxis protein CheY
MEKLTNVLVVDDSPTMRMLIAFSLGRYNGCRVREAGNGVEAVEAVERQLPDLMVVDINMPEMNGLELIQALRRTHPADDLPIVVITTEGSDSDIRKGFQAGANEYLVKPFQPHKLHAIIDRMLERDAV